MLQQAVLQLLAMAVLASAEHRELGLSTEVATLAPATGAVVDDDSGAAGTLDEHSNEQPIAEAMQVMEKTKDELDAQEHCCKWPYVGCRRRRRSHCPNPFKPTMCSLGEVLCFILIPTPIEAAAGCAGIYGGMVGACTLLMADPATAALGAYCHAQIAEIGPILFAACMADMVAGMAFTHDQCTKAMCK